MNPSKNAAKHYHAKFKVPSRATLKIGKWCLDSPSLLPEQQIYLNNCNKKSTSQVFSIGIVKGSYFTLVPRNSRMCMDLFAFKMKNYAKIVTWPCNYKGNQWWYAVVGGEKTTSAKTFIHKSGFMIKSGHSGKCLAPYALIWKNKKPVGYGIRAANQAKLIQMKCNPRDVNMRFKLTAR